MSELKKAQCLLCVNDHRNTEMFRLEIKISLMVRNFGRPVYVVDVTAKLCYQTESKLYTKLKSPVCYIIMYQCLSPEESNTVSK